MICLTLFPGLLPGPGEKSFITEPGCCCRVLAGCGMRCSERGGGAHGRIWISTPSGIGKPFPAWRNPAARKSWVSGAWGAALCGDEKLPVCLCFLWSVVWPNIGRLLSAEGITRPLFSLVGLWFKGKQLSYQPVLTTGTSSCNSAVLQAAICSFSFEELVNCKEVTPCLSLLPCCCVAGNCIASVLNLEVGNGRNFTAPLICAKLNLLTSWWCCMQGMLLAPARGVSTQRLYRTVRLLTKVSCWG